MASRITINRSVFSVFFLVAGLNHFIHPEFYLPLIPNYFPWKVEINAISGVLEIVTSLFIWHNKLRKITSYATVFLLICFIPAHVHFIKLGSCIENGLCVPVWIGWARLLIIHPILFLWTWKTGQH